MIWRGAYPRIDAVGDEPLENMPRNLGVRLDALRFGAQRKSPRPSQAIQVRCRDHALRRALIDGVTAAATGAIAGAVFVLGRRALTDVATWTMFAVALAIILRAKKVAEPVLIVAAGVVGILLHVAT